ncbi:SET domain-containing protein 3 [Coemansia biformis]|uniref:SET domain-containing protein 3 n=1 Tax=Coemansia biformis TaxID=1286918 RepID=A0A9W8D118_9FUNG|nr:SET domain-containing protein 3 [Coemansia biformis]
MRDTSGDSTPDEDQGVIRCICNIDDDDGFTIQCENCLVWQHAVCVDVEQDNVPDEYLCEKCNPRKLDVKVSVDYQKRRLDSEYKVVKETRKRQRYAPAKGKRAEDLAERRKRPSDVKLPRSKSTKGMPGRESLSPMGVQSPEKARDSPAALDGGYVWIDRSILGTDVQVLFHSVLSQLADQRNVVSSAAAAAAAAAAAVSASAAPALPVAPPNGAATTPAPMPTAPGDANGSGPSAPPADDRTSNVAAALVTQPSVVAINRAELDSPAQTYRALGGKEHGQVGLFVNERIRAHGFICEYRGQVVLKAAYKEDPKNYYELLRTTRPYSHFHREIDLCVDARRQGSEARFARRSCEANAVLKSMYVSADSGAEADASILLGLFAMRGIEAGDELTVGWEWEDGELPAVAAMSPSDAEDYLGRPEGRRMSKVWRQVFGGMACACQNPSCDVRRLFAMLGVEESLAPPHTRADPGLGRRPSRPHRAEDADHCGASPVSARSPGAHSHSRKSSVSGVHDGPKSPTQSRARDVLSVQSGTRLESAPASRQSSMDASLAAARQRLPNNDIPRDGDGDGDGDSNNSGNDNSNGSSHASESRKRKPRTQPAAPAISRSAHSGSSESDCDDDNSKKQCTARGTHCSDMPLKKLWISRYLERADVHPGSGLETNKRDVDERSAGERDVDKSDAIKKDVGEQDVGEQNAGEQTAGARDAVRPESRANSARPQSVPPAEAREESGRAIVKSAPTDADAPTPSPSSSPSLPGDAHPVDAKETPASRAADEPATEAVSLTVDTGAGPNGSLGGDDKHGAAASEAAAASSAGPPTPAKKQRLSLEEYNKRRRGHNTARDGEPRGAAAGSETGSSKADAGAATPTSPPWPQPTPPPPPPLGLLLSQSSIQTGPPEPPLLGHRFDRGPAPPFHRAGERETGEIAPRRDFRVRSRSRERGGREHGGREQRRYNSFGAGPGAGAGPGFHQQAPLPPPPGRGAGEWRANGYTPGAMRAMSMSPVQPPGPAQAPADGQPQQHHHHHQHRGGGPRRIGSSGSRGGSPAHR